MSLTGLVSHELSFAQWTLESALRLERVERNIVLEVSMMSPFAIPRYVAAKNSKAGLLVKAAMVELATDVHWN